MIRILAFSLILVCIGCGPEESQEDDFTHEVASEWHLDVEWVTLPVESHHFRGLHVISEDEAWITGTDGIFMYTNDGEGWFMDSIPVVSGMDLRDVEVMNDSTALVMTAGSPGLILKTSNNGIDWTVVYENQDSLVFMDGMDFWKDYGIVYGDPLDGYHFILMTLDGGDTWQRITEDFLPAVLEVEMGYAASGTGVVVVGDHYFYVGYGGEESRVGIWDLKGNGWSMVSTPMAHGQGGDGIYSMSFKDTMNGIAVGGNWEFEDSDSSKIWTEDGGVNWNLADGVQGYRSGSCYVGADIYLSTGTNGTDISLDGGRSWRMLSNEGFNAIQFAPQTGNAIDGGFLVMKWLGYAVGSHGKIAKLKLSYY